MNHAPNPFERMNILLNNIPILLTKISKLLFGHPRFFSHSDYSYSFIIGIVVLMVVFKIIFYNFPSCNSTFVWTTISEDGLSIE